MDPTKPHKQPDPTSSQTNPTSLTSTVEAHSAYFEQLNAQLNSAFASVRSDIDDLRQSSLGANAGLSNLSQQLTSMTNVFSENFSRIFSGQNATNLADSDDSFSDSEIVPVQPVSEPRLPTPQTFEGDLSLCRGFLSQCELLFVHQPSRYSSPKSRVALIVSLLSGRALQWAVATLEKHPLLASNYKQFIGEFKLVFDHPPEGSDLASKLLTISQGTRSVADYAVEFRILAAECKWNDDALACAFRAGLSDTIKDLILRDRPSSLSELITLALQVDSRLRERRQERSRRANPRFPPNQSYSQSRQLFKNRAPMHKARNAPNIQPNEEPMEIGHTRLTREEREYRFKNGLCLSCGQEGHVARQCAPRPKDTAH